MLLKEGLDVQGRDARSRLAFSRNQPIKHGSWKLDRKSTGGARNIGGDGDCRVCAAAGDLRIRLAGGDGNEFIGQIGGFSHESEHDLAIMVSDFLENGSTGAESRCSSDSDSGFTDPNHFVESVRFLTCSADHSESAMLSTVQSLLLSIDDANLLSANVDRCNCSCIRQSLVKLLRLSGYDAAVCISTWQGFGNVPGGDHEYLDVILNDKVGSSDRLIIDIDLRSHFEIARAVDSYNAVLNSLPIIFVGSMAKLNQLLQIMVDAAKYSLNQNSMPLPPWRSLPYLQAKWQSDYERKPLPQEQNDLFFTSLDHKQCIGHLRRLKSSVHSEIDAERLLKPITNDKKRMDKLDRRQFMFSN